MAESTDPEESLSNRVIKEAVERGMETELRKPIVEAVDTARDDSSMKKRRLPLYGLLLGIAGSIGYMLGRLQSEDSEIIPIEQDHVETATEAISDVRDDSTEDEDDGQSRMRKVLVAIGIIGAIAYIRRRSKSTDEEWEPIQQFETPIAPESTVTDDGSSTAESTMHSIDSDSEFDSPGSSDSDNADIEP